MVAKTISERWAMGDPISRPELYMELEEAFTDGTPLFSQFLDPEKDNTGQQKAKWLSNTLARQGWSIRKRTVSQKVPENWFELAIECSEDILEQCEAAGIEHLVNADQTFMNFYHESEKVIAPRGAKRVGGNKQVDEKAGCTLMVTADLLNSKLLKPFIVLNGKTGATLDKEYVFWDQLAGNTCTVAFQKKHWFDTPITLRWLRWLKAQFPPNAKVGLIWDHAPAHDSAEVSTWLDANTDWLTVMLIPGGMTSIMQVCDVAANAQLKKLIRKWYMKWRRTEITRLRNAGHVGHLKLKLPRDEFIRGAEKITKDFNELEKTSRSIEKCFTRLGQNFEKPTESRAAVRDYLNKMRDSDVFGIEQLVEMIDNNQTATTMVDQADEVDWAPEEAREM